MFNRRSISQAEMNALLSQVMSRMHAGDTIPRSGVYEPMMKRLSARAAELESDNKIEMPKSVSDWLAIGLFANDRMGFIKLCQQAAKDEDPVYKRAENWLKKIIQDDIAIMQDNQKKT